MTPEDRMKVIGHIRNPISAFRIFLISTLAGGTGLNLENATHALMIDEHWNPSYEAQAVDRIYRGGQTREVNVYRFLTRNTIDHKVHVKQIKKQSLLK